MKVNMPPAKPVKELSPGRLCPGKLYRRSHGPSFKQLNVYMCVKDVARDVYMLVDQTTGYVYRSDVGDRFVEVEGELNITDMHWEE